MSKSYFLHFFIIIGITFVQLNAAVHWNDFRLHYNSVASKGFCRQPRTSTDAEQKGWKRISSKCYNDENQFVGFRYEDPKDYGVVLIYDINGIVAGMQSRLPHDQIIGPKNVHRFDLVPMYQNVTENGRLYFIVTVYFVDPKIICTSGRTKIDLTKGGTGTGIWFQNGPTYKDLIEAPKARSVANAGGWTKVNCLPGMGYHNIYQLETYTLNNCTVIYPAFLLYNTNQELFGFGFTTRGKADSNYFEHPPSGAMRGILGEPVPQCLVDSNDLIGTTTLHVFFVNNVWLLTCS